MLRVIHKLTNYPLNITHSAHNNDYIFTIRVHTSNILFSRYISLQKNIIQF